MKTIKKSQIIDVLLACPYCGTEQSDSSLGCCGESSAHFCKAYDLKDGSRLLEWEVEVVDTEDKNLNKIINHYFKQTGEYFQLYASYDNEHFHFIAARPTLTEVTLIAMDLYKEAQ